MPPIILEDNEIRKDQCSIFHYSRLYKYSELFNIVNNILRNINIPPKILEPTLAIINKLLNNINYYEITGSLYICQKKCWNCYFI